jgi:hypothetical protein
MELKPTLYRVHSSIQIKAIENKYLVVFLITYCKLFLDMSQLAVCAGLQPGQVFPADPEMNRLPVNRLSCIIHVIQETAYEILIYRKENQWRKVL